jgi:hypothetical protein
MGLLSTQLKLQRTKCGFRPMCRQQTLSGRRERPVSLNLADGLKCAIRSYAPLGTIGEAASMLEGEETKFRG